jgi:ubiquitin-activating enzyme E1
MSLSLLTRGDASKDSSQKIPLVTMMKLLPTIGLALLMLANVISSSPFGRTTPSWFPRLRFSPPDQAIGKNNVSPTHASILASTSPQTTLRGGGNAVSTSTTTTKEEETDEERYSRQVYTLGARAHGLVRSSTIFIDGPATSGLLYECAKNLALSGVGSIVILVSKSDDDNKMDESYHNSNLDDLGNAYQRAARAEIGHEAPEDDETVLMEYLKRLNPSVTVSIAQRPQLSSTKEKPGVLLCVDRPYSTQVTLNNKCRHEGLAFVAVETAGVYGRTFCDFGPSFEVVDGDGETPLVVPLDRIESLDEELVQVHCIEGEKHDVSKGDVIQFQLSSGETLAVECTVVKVQNPRLFTARFSLDGDDSLEDTVSRVNQEATSFSRTKIPEKVQFVPLEDATQQAKDDGSLFTPCDLEKSFDTDRRDIIFASFQAIEDFVKKHGKLPTKADVDAFEEMARRRLSSQSANDDPRVGGISEAFCKSCAGKLTPIQAILGAITAQEVLKATTGVYNPVQQFLLYDCDELLPDTCDDSDCGTTGQSYILGQSLCDALANSRLFVVGAGTLVQGSHALSLVFVQCCPCTNEMMNITPYRSNRL